MARYTARKISPTPKFAARLRGPPTAPRAGAAPTETHTRIVVVYPIECDHIYVNRVISHEVIVSECITLQTLHRRFRPGTPCVGLILKTYSCQKYKIYKGRIQRWRPTQRMRTDNSMHFPSLKPQQAGEINWRYS